MFSPDGFEKAIIGVSVTTSQPVIVYDNGLGWHRR